MSDNTLRAILLPENIQMAYQDQAEAITEAIDILLDVLGADLVTLRRDRAVNHGTGVAKLCERWSTEWIEVSDADTQ